MRTSTSNVGIPVVTVLTSLLSGINAHAQAREDAGSSMILQEITVTASRREETINRVPISVTAFDAKALDDQGVVSIDDVARLTPGLTFTRSGYADTTSISIRGIASGVGTGTTGIYIDDTPVQVRSLGFASANLYPENFDLERVEVLRGPQGTLFGAGSEGGTVRFITTQPSLSTYSGNARVDFSVVDGSDTSHEFGAAFGGPIVQDKLGFRASAWGRHKGGNIDRVSPVDGSVLQNDSNSSDSYAGRLALAYEPIEDLRITLAGYYQEINKNGADSFYQSLSSKDEFRAAEPFGSPTRDRYALTSLTIQANLGDAFTLTSVTSDLWREGVPTQDYTHLMPILLLGPQVWDNSVALEQFPGYASSAEFVNKQNNFTQEVRIQTADTGSPFSGTLGLFYTKARQESTQTIFDPVLNDLTMTYFGGATVEQFFGVPMLPGSVSYISNDAGIDEQKAIFGEFSYEMAHGLKATVGLRYAKSDFSFANRQVGPWAGPDPEPKSGSQSESPVTPKFGLSWQKDDQNMFYTTVSKGFRIGGANRHIPVTSGACRDALSALGLSNAPDSYNSDYVWSYEVGAKNGGFDGRLQVNSSLYYIKWSDIQQSVYLSPCGFDFVSNLGSAVSKGGDVQVQALLTHALTVGLSVAYNDAYYDQTIFSRNRAGDIVNIVSEGNTLPHTPWSVVVSGDYKFDAFGQSSYARVTYSHNSSPDGTSPGRDPRNQGYDPDAFRGPATNYTALRVGTEFASGLEVSIYADNLFNSRPILTRWNDVEGSKLFYTTTFERTIGVRGAYRF